MLGHASHVFAFHLHALAHGTTLVGNPTLRLVAEAPDGHDDHGLHVSLVHADGHRAAWVIRGAVAAGWSHDGSTYLVLDRDGAVHVGRHHEAPHLVPGPCEDPVLSPDGALLVSHAPGVHHHVHVDDLRHHHRHHLSARHGLRVLSVGHHGHVRFACEAHDTPILGELHSAADHHGHALAHTWSLTVHPHGAEVHAEAA